MFKYNQWKAGCKAGINRGSLYCRISSNLNHKLAQWDQIIASSFIMAASEGVGGGGGADVLNLPINPIRLLKLMNRHNFMIFNHETTNRDASRAHTEHRLAACSRCMWFAWAESTEKANQL